MIRIYILRRSRDGIKTEGTDDRKVVSPVSESLVKSSIVTTPVELRKGSYTVLCPVLTTVRQRETEGGIENRDRDKNI